MTEPGDGWRRRRRVGLLGGTFDPIHVGHLVVAEHLLVELGLDEVRLLVAGAPWMKGQVTDAEYRLAMAQAAVAGIDGIVVDGRECRRGGPTYTADTLDELTAEEPDTDWFFCLGADAAANLHRWERASDAMAMASFVIVNRPGTPWSDVDEPDHGRILKVPAMEISSTDIRERYAQERATRFLVPPSVHHQIVERGLYRADDA